LIALVIFGGPLIAIALVATILIKSGHRRRSRPRVITGSLLWLPAGLLAFCLIRSFAPRSLPSIRDLFGETPASVASLTVDRHEGCDFRDLYFRFRVSPDDYHRLSDLALAKPHMNHLFEFPASGDFHLPPAWWAIPPSKTAEFLRLSTPEDDNYPGGPLITIAMWYDAPSRTAFVCQSELR
jgi:hypothetical protein